MKKIGISNSFSESLPPYIGSFRTSSSSFSDPVELFPPLNVVDLVADDSNNAYITKTSIEVMGSIVKSTNDAPTFQVFVSEIMVDLFSETLTDVDSTEVG